MGEGLTAVLVEGVVSQSEWASALGALETAAVEEEALCTQTLHHVEPPPADGAHLTDT